MQHSEAVRDIEADAAATIARGLLLALATPSIAALALDSGVRSAATLHIFAEIATIPGFLAVAGWLLARQVIRQRPARLLRSLAPMAACAAAAATFAAAAAPLAGHDWRAGIALAAPVWRLALLPAVYALVAASLRGAPGLLLALAATAHVAGVILGMPALAQFIFFVVGVMLAERREAFSRLVDEEPECALASGPFVAVLSAAVAIRFAQTGQPLSIAAVGPIALALGLAAAPTALASAGALRRRPSGEAFARLGRAAPALAVCWIPLFATLIAAANRGAAPSAASALLMAFASLLVIAVIADMALDAREKAGFTGAPARR